jgi:predicted DNA binding CopG/RHH family protein
MQEELKKQSFKSEAEEAQWWYDNQDALAQEFKKAAAEGTLDHGTVARKGKTPTTTIRLDPEDISKARRQAELKGLRYQTYLKMLIHESLWQAEVQLGFSNQGEKKNTAKGRSMAEQRRQEGYAVRKPSSGRASAVLPAQAKAISKAKELNPGRSPHVEPDRYRKVTKADKQHKPQ